MDEEETACGAFLAEEKHQQKPEGSLAGPELLEPSQEGREEGDEVRGGSRGPDQGQDVGFTRRY